MSIIVKMCNCSLWHTANYSAVQLKRSRSWWIKFWYEKEMIYLRRGLRDRRYKFAMHWRVDFKWIWGTFRAVLVFGTHLMHFWDTLIWYIFGTRWFDAFLGHANRFKNWSSLDTFLRIEETLKFVADLMGFSGDIDYILICDEFDAYFAQRSITWRVHAIQVTL